MHVEFSFACCMAELVHQIFATKARWSLTFGDDRTGYIEIHAVEYKCARLSRVTGRPFIVLIPVWFVRRELGTSSCRFSCNQRC